MNVLNLQRVEIQKSQHLDYIFMSSLHRKSLVEVLLPLFRHLIRVNKMKLLQGKSFL